MDMYVWSVIIGGFIVTIIPRVLPITVLSKLNLNKNIMEFLTYIPISILASLIAVELFTKDNRVSIISHSPELLAAAVTLIIGIKKNNLLLTVLVGIISVAIFRLLI